MLYPDRESIIRAAKNIRAIYEYDYMQNPVSAADIINSELKSKQIVLYPDTEHSRVVAVHLATLGCDCVVANEKFLFENTESVALIGYWNEIGIKEFCDRFDVPTEKIFLPYMKVLI